VQCTAKHLGTAWLLLQRAAAGMLALPAQHCSRAAAALGTEAAHPTTGCFCFCCCSAAQTAPAAPPAPAALRRSHRQAWVVGHLCVCADVVRVPGVHQPLVRHLLRTEVGALKHVLGQRGALCLCLVVHHEHAQVGLLPGGAAGAPRLLILLALLLNVLLELCGEAGEREWGGWVGAWVGAGQQVGLMECG
jgi:hypothetical protein